MQQVKFFMKTVTIQLGTKDDKSIVHISKVDTWLTIINKSDYIQKMGNILHDKTKFLNMGSVNLHDNTAKNEQKLQKRLLDFVPKK